MARIEKTVFISYRRKDISWALAVYQYLTSQKFDVFFDFSSLSSGDFEQVIVSNIKARAHFILILTPSALDRCTQPGDWLTREIETAIDEKRNIIPLFFDGFSFDSPSVTEKLTGKLGAINHYNGLEVPPGYFMEAMERLDERYLNIPLDAVIHPVSGEVGKVVKNEQKAANKAVLQRKDIRHPAFPPEREKSGAKSEIETGRDRNTSKVMERVLNLRPYGIGTGILLIAILGIVGVNSLIKTITAKDTLTPTEHAVANTSIPTRTRIIPTNTATTVPPTPIPILGVGSTMISPKDGMAMLYVPAGEFEMGSDGWDDDEKPAHRVYLNAFWIDQTEVTNAMFSKFVNDTGYVTDAQRAGQSYVLRDSLGTTSGANWMHPSGSDSDIAVIMAHPVVQVSWNDANSYCSWADRRLPTEAEWEKAANWDEEKRQKNVYPWGDLFDTNLLNFCDTNCSYNGAVKNVDDGFATTAPVSSYPDGASYFGVMDMAGNVMEWVADKYSETYYQNSPTFNPLGPDSGQLQVVRGGAWSNDYGSVRTANRFAFTSTPPNDYLGFRCSQSAAFGIGSRKVSETDDMTMVYVPAGEFEMGSNSGDNTEKPIHTVHLDSFWIDQTEVTNAMYAKCVRAGRCSPPASGRSETRENYYGNMEFDDYPAINITWVNADLYCEWAGRRLPTEAEWEKAAGWDDNSQRKYIYPWGNSVNCTLTNFKDGDTGCIGDTTEVGSYLNGKSPYGALDMAGNVLEWVNDWYDENYYSISPVSNPSGPDSGQYRVFRGGSWGDSWWSLRVSWRGFYDPSSTWYNDGFRCAMSASE